MYTAVKKHVRGRKVLAIALTAVMLFGLLQAASPIRAYAAGEAPITAYATGAAPITALDAASDAAALANTINSSYNKTNNINGKLTASAEGSVVTVTGDYHAGVTIDIPAGVSVNWAAKISSDAGFIIAATGEGVFNLVDGGEISGSGSRGTALIGIAVYDDVKVNIKGGSILMGGVSGAAVIAYSNNTVAISGGTLRADGTFPIGVYARNITMTGGELTAIGNVPTGIYIPATPDVATSVDISGGEISAIGTKARAIDGALPEANITEVTISGGTVYASGQNSVAILCCNVTITDGEVGSDGTAIHMSRGGSRLTLDGGSVWSDGAECSAVSIDGGGGDYGIDDEGNYYLINRTPAYVNVNSGSVTAKGANGRGISFEYEYDVLTIRGGTVAATGQSGYGVFIGSYGQRDDNVIRVEGGTVSGPSAAIGCYGRDNNMVYITGSADVKASAASAVAAVDSGNGAIITIDGGTVSAFDPDNGTAVMAYHAVYVSGGTVQGLIRANPERAAYVMGYYMGDRSAMFNTNFNPANLVQLDKVTLTANRSAYEYDANNPTFYPVVAALDSHIKLDSVTVNGAEGTVNLKSNTVTFNDEMNASDVTLTVKGSVVIANGNHKGGKIPLDFTTPSMGVNRKLPSHKITSVSPQVVLSGYEDIVTLTGENLKDVTTVLIDGETTKIASKSDTKIEFSAPGYSIGSAEIVLMTHSGASAPAYLHFVSEEMKPLVETILGFVGKTQERFSLFISDDGVITVTGEVVKEYSGDFDLNIPEDVTVKWNAKFSGSLNYGALINLTGDGLFELTENGELAVSSNGGAINVKGDDAKILISGGRITGSFSTGIDNAICVNLSGERAELAMTDGLITVTSSYPIVLNGANARASISGGAVNCPTERATRSPITVNPTGTNAEVVITGGTLRTYLASGIAIYMRNGIVYYSGGFVGHIDRVSSSNAKGYFVGTNDSMFSSNFTYNTNLFWLSNVSRTANGSSYSYSSITASEYPVVAKLNSNLDLANASVTASAGDPTIDKTAKTVTFNKTVNNSAVTITVSGAKIAGTNIPVTFTTAAFGVNVVPPPKTDVSANISFTPGSAAYTGAELDCAEATISGITAGASPSRTYSYDVGGTGASLGASNKPLTAGTYTVTAVYEDDDNYGTASGIFTVDKANQTAPGAPTLGGKTAESLTISPVSATSEYALNTTNTAPSDGWQDGLTFDGLAPNTTYFVFARMKADDNNNASPASPALTVITNMAALASGMVSISGTAKYGEILTAAATGLTSTPSVSLGALTYMWVRDGTTPLRTGDNASYTIVQDDIGHTITVTVMTTNATGSVTSAATGTIAKADGPAAPALNFSVSDGEFPKTVTITAVTGAEYSFDGGLNYSAANTFTSVTGEALDLAIRLAATATHEASGASAETIDTTIQNQNPPDTTPPTDTTPPADTPPPEDTTPPTDTTPPRDTTINDANKTENADQVSITVNGADGVTISARVGEKIGDLPTPKKSGSEFLGWYSGSQKITTDTVVTEGMTITAKWASTDNILKKLAKSTGSISPKFKGSRTSYKLTIAKGKSSVRITPTKNNSKAKLQIKIAGGKYKSVKSVTVKLNKGKSKTVTIKVTSESGATKTYKVKVIRKK